MLIDLANIQFKEYSQGMEVVFPSRLDENIASDAPVRLVNRIVDDLDISPLLSTYKGGGCLAYYPRMLLKVLFFAYLNNVYSCRKIVAIFIVGQQKYPKDTKAMKKMEGTLLGHPLDTFTQHKSEIKTITLLPEKFRRHCSCHSTIRLFRHRRMGLRLFCNGKCSNTFPHPVFRECDLDSNIHFPSRRSRDK